MPNGSGAVRIAATTYCAFAKRIVLSKQKPLIKARVAASYYYELYIDGRVGRARTGSRRPPVVPVRRTRVSEKGRRAACSMSPSSSITRETRTFTASSMRRAGVIAEIDAGGFTMGTNDTWKCVDLGHVGRRRSRARVGAGLLRRVRCAPRAGRLGRQTLARLSDAGPALVAAVVCRRGEHLGRLHATG